MSVALCTFEGARFIEAQLRSILDQTHAVSEIVVSDDGSSDDTLQIVDRVAADSAIPIAVRRHEPLGVAGNFADAIGATTGDVIALSDQDDVWHPGRIERLLPELAGVDLVHTDARLVDADGRDLGTTLLESLEASAWERDRMQHGGAFEALLRRNLVTGATVLVRGDVARSSMPVPEGWIHDEWLAMACALRGGVRLVPEATIDYRQHGANAIGVQSLSFGEKLRRLVDADGGAHDRKARRASSAAATAARLQLGTSTQRAALVEKARHERTRAALPAGRLARVPTILRGLAHGRYRSYSRGVLDVARDLLERHTRTDARARR